MNGNITELYVNKILDFSSQYGSEIGSSYSILNFLKKPTIYPAYGDFSNAAVFRTYGTFWKQCSSKLKDIKSVVCENSLSEDFVEFSIEYPVIVCKFEIFETYNPGSVEKIYFYLPEGWSIMWERPANSNDCILKKSRIFSPNIKKQSVPCDKFRIEINQSRCEYYAEIDAVKVSGYRDLNMELAYLEKLSLKSMIKEKIQFNTTPAILTSDKTKMLILNFHCFFYCQVQKYEYWNKNLHKDSNIEIINFNNFSDFNEKSSTFSISQDYISYLPEEILINIFSYFPLKTLSTIASVSRRFLRSVNQAMTDIKEINFRNVWSKLDHPSLIWIGSKCINLSRVDLSWCGKNVNFTLFGLCHFLTLVGAQLITLRLSACSAVNDVVLRSIVKNCSDLEDLDLSSCVNISSHSFSDLQYLYKIKYLNLYRTNIDSQSIESAVVSWSNLQHLNLGSCIKIDKWNDVIKTISIHCRELISIDLWRSNISNEALKELVMNCRELEELELGWCTLISSEAGSFTAIAQNIPHLKKLYLTSNRSVTDSDLTALALMCPLLEQLDVLGAPRITAQSVMLLLQNCTNLKMLDLSFCGSIDRRQILQWTSQYPNCSILVSYQDQLFTKT